MSLRTLALLPLLLAACGDKSDDTGADGGAGDGGAEPVMVQVFPTGSSTWTGTAELSGAALGASLDVTRTGGVLEGTISVDLSGTALTFGVVGTIDDQSGQFALAPTGWVGEDPGLGMVGISGVYDPADSSLRGMIRDTTSWDSPTLQGGPFSATGETPPDEVEESTIAADPQVGTAGVSYSGTSLCTSDARPVLGTLTRGADGTISGTLSFSELDGSFVGTFGLLGVEDATTGSLTLLPTPWTEEESDATNYANYYVHGTVVAGEYTGRVYLNNSAACPDGGFQVRFE